MDQSHRSGQFIVAARIRHFAAQAACGSPLRSVRVTHAGASRENKLDLRLFTGQPLIKVGARLDKLQRKSSTRGSTDRGVVDLVRELIERAIAARATDIHCEPTDDGLLIRVRVDSILHDVERLPGTIAANVVARLKVLGGLLTYCSDLPQEGVIAASGSDFSHDIRVATFPTVRGERAVLRILSAAHSRIGLDGLGHSHDLIASLKRCLQRQQGLLLVCGPAGSGKTTTLFALLEYLLAQRPGASIFAVEDPVEIRLSGVTQVQIDAARGLTYPVALRSLLRQDPQILMIGEVRDAETARVVIEAALTGHLLLSTLHSGSASEAIVRLAEMGLPSYQITSALCGVLAQRLVRTICGVCHNGPAKDDCQACLGTGMAGRTAFGHWVEIGAALRRAIIAGSDAATLRKAELMPGSLRSDAARLIESGATTRDEVCRVLGDS